MSALARPAGAGLVAAVLLVASGLAGPAPAAHATSRLPTPCPRAGLEIVRDLPRWAIPIRGRSNLAAFEGRLTGRRVRTAAELEVDGNHSPPGLRVWTFAVERVLAGTLPPTVEVWSEGRARTAAGGSRAPDGTVPLVVGEQYQVTALWLPPRG